MSGNMDMDVLDRCKIHQEEEISTLEAIYPDLITVLPNPQNKPGTLLALSIPITLSQDVHTTLRPSLRSQPAATHASLEPESASSSSSSTVNAPFATLPLTHLPPLTIRLVLPDSYPISVPARVVSIKAIIPGDPANTAWLPRNVLRKVQDKITELWEEEKRSGGDQGEGVGMLWRWWEWIATGDFLVDAGCLMSDSMSLTVPPSLSSAAFHTLLKTYNAQQIHAGFENTAFSCSICFENRKGKRCVQMPCGCVFCYGCLNACWSLAISEGTLEAVACPSPPCVKSRATRTVQAEQDPTDHVEPELVESVVGPDLRQRWQELRIQRRAETDPTYTICPRPTCQSPVPPPADLLSSSTAPSSASAPEDRWSRYRQCPTCHFSFCLYCSATWHGAHTPCSFPQTSAIVLEYLSHPEGSTERQMIEKRRGKRNIDKMVARYIEDEANKEWLENQTRACSGCGVRVEKSHGCNHMTCGRCGAHFCYRCGESLRPLDPYAHYRKPGTSCFEKLFDQEEIARFERETAMQHAGMGELYGDEWGPRHVWEW